MQGRRHGGRVRHIQAVHAEPLSIQPHKHPVDVHDKFSQFAAVSNPLDLLRHEHTLPKAGVPAHKHEVFEAGLHHDLRRLPVLPDVKFRRGGHISPAEAGASHDHHPAGLFHRLRLQPQCQSQVGEGAQGDDVDLPLPAVSEGLKHPPDSVPLPQAQPLRGEAQIPHAVLPVGLIGEGQLLQEHISRPHVHRRLTAPRPLDGEQGVSRRLARLHVAGHDGEHENLVCRVPEGHGDGHGVVRAAVRIDNQLFPGISCHFATSCHRTTNLFIIAHGKNNYNFLPFSKLR